jgi:hypothetical protein
MDEFSKLRQRAIGPVRLFVPYQPTEEDLKWAAAIPRDQCPRRYCWYWHSLRFDWQVSITDGCQWLTASPPNSIGRECACVRADPESILDHYESREPHLKEDGFGQTRWFALPSDVAREQQARLLAELRKAGWKDDGEYLWAPNRTRRQIVGFPYWGPSPSRPLTAQEYLARVESLIVALQLRLATDEVSELARRIDDLASLTAVLRRLIDEERW